MKRNKIFSFLALSIAILQTSCAISPPFKGPKFNTKENRLDLDPKQMVTVAITNASLISGKRNGFDTKSNHIYKKIDSYPGYLGGTVRREVLGDQVWTLTVWENEVALKNFVDSTMHLDAMYMENNAMKKIRTTNINLPASLIPLTWEQAQRIINQKDLRDHKPF